MEGLAEGEVDVDVVMPVPKLTRGWQTSFGSIVPELGVLAYLWQARCEAMDMSLRETGSGTYVPDLWMIAGVPMQRVRILGAICPNEPFPLSELYFGAVERLTGGVVRSGELWSATAACRDYAEVAEALVGQWRDFVDLLDHEGRVLAIATTTTDDDGTVTEHTHALVPAGGWPPELDVVQEPDVGTLPEAVRPAAPFYGVVRAICQTLLLLIGEDDIAFLQSRPERRWNVRFCGLWAAAAAAEVARMAQERLEAPYNPPMMARARGYAMLLVLMVLA